MKDVSTKLYSKGAASFGRRAAWVALIIIVLAVLAVVLTPAWIIQPFRPQSQQGLEASYALRSWSPIVTLLASATLLVLMLWLWRGARAWWRRGVLIVALILTGTATWLARQNHFEWMFNPLPHAAYAKANEASFVADADMVMAIEIGGDAVAYPVRQIAYHHVVQDTVGGIPVVATY